TGGGSLGDRTEDQADHNRQNQHVLDARGQRACVGDQLDRPVEAAEEDRHGRHGQLEPRRRDEPADEEHENDPAEDQRQVRLRHRYRDRDRGSARDARDAQGQRAVAEPAVRDRRVTAGEERARRRAHRPTREPGQRRWGVAPAPYFEISARGTPFATTPRIGAEGVRASSCWSWTAACSRVWPMRATRTIASTIPSIGITSLTASGPGASISTRS